MLVGLNFRDAFKLFHLLLPLRIVRFVDQRSYYERLQLAVPKASVFSSTALILLISNLIDLIEVLELTPFPIAFIANQQLCLA